MVRHSSAAFHRRFDDANDIIALLLIANTGTLQKHIWND